MYKIVIIYQYCETSKTECYMYTDNYTLAESVTKSRSEPLSSYILTVASQLANYVIGKSM